MPDNNQESLEQTGADNDQENYDQWENELNQEKRLAVENAELKKEKTGPGLANTASSLAGDLLKKQIKKSFWKLALKFLVTFVVPYIPIIFLILLIIFILYYFISNPCEAARYIGAWWATAVGEFCKAVGK